MMLTNTNTLTRDYAHLWFFHIFLCVLSLRLCLPFGRYGCTIKGSPAKHKYIGNTFPDSLVSLKHKNNILVPTMTRQNRPAGRANVHKNMQQEKKRRGTVERRKVRAFYIYIYIYLIATCVHKYSGTKWHKVLLLPGFAFLCSSCICTDIEHIKFSLFSAFNCSPPFFFLLLLTFPHCFFRIIYYLHVSLVSSISFSSSLLFRTAPILSALSAPNCG